MVSQEMNALAAAPLPAPVPIVAPRTTYPAFMLGLPPTPSGLSINEAKMSRDGGVVFMQTADMGTDAAYELWRSDGSFVTINRNNLATNYQLALSGDGNVLAYAFGPLDTRVRNLSTGVEQPLNAAGAPPPGANFFATGMNNDGSIIVGYSDTFTYVARWDLVGGAYQYTPVLDNLNAAIQGDATCVNDQGTIIAGRERGGNLPAYWTRQTGNQYSQTVLSNAQGMVVAITPDGAYMTGTDTSLPLLAYHAFRAASDGSPLQYLPPLAGDNFNLSYGISMDGQVVVGLSANSGLNTSRAFFWTPTLGSQDINAHLSTHGVNLGGAQLSYAAAVSGDGSIVLCMDSSTRTLYLARIDGDYLGLSSPTNVYASLAGITAGSSNAIISSLPISQLPNTSLAFGTIPAAGGGGGDNVLRVWGTGAFMSNYEMDKGDIGGVGGAGAIYFMDSGLSFGLSAFYGYRSLYSLWDSKQTLDNMSFALHTGYAPEVTGIRLSLGAMVQDYDLDTRRNYPNGADMSSSVGSGHGWGFGFVSHAGWVFELVRDVTIQPFAEYTWQWTQAPDYSESGGPFPAHYDGHNFTQNITRLGFDLQWDVTPTLNLQAWLAWNHRFESEGPASSGSIMGWEPFYFSGASLKQNWGDTGLGFRWRFMDNTALGFRLGFGIDNQDSGLPDLMSSVTLSVDI